MRTRLLLAFTLAACLLASGCALPVSEHPLSNEDTSTIDEGLIGYWQFVPKEKDEKPPPMPHVVSKQKDKPNVLQMTFIELDGEGYATVQNVPLYATKIGEERYLSFRMSDEGEAKPSYLICRYEVGEDTGKLFLLKPDETAAAIEGGKLKGVVRRSKRREGADPNEPTRFEEIRITAEPKELEAFLKDRGKAAFQLEEHLEFRRIKSE